MHKNKKTLCTYLNKSAHTYSIYFISFLIMCTTPLLNIASFHFVGSSGSWPYVSIRSRMPHEPHTCIHTSALFAKASTHCAFVSTDTCAYVWMSFMTSLRHWERASSLCAKVRIRREFAVNVDPEVLCTRKSNSSTSTSIRSVWGAVKPRCSTGGF